MGATVHEDDTVFRSEQDIQLRCGQGLTPDGMAWPLVPQAGYLAPMHRATRSLESKFFSASEQELRGFGVSHDMVQKIGAAWKGNKKTRSLDDATKFQELVCGDVDKKYLNQIGKPQGGEGGCVVM